MLNAHRELNCLGEDWGGHPTSAQHLVGHLLGRFRVIWINSLGCRTPRLSHHDFARALSKLRAAARGVERPRPDLFVYTPLVVPWFRSAAVLQRIDNYLRSGTCFAYIQAALQPAKL